MEEKGSYRCWKIVGEFSQDHRKMLRIACPDCGFEYSIRRTNFRDERTCRRCRFVVSNRASLGKHRGCGDLTKTYYNYFKNTARKRGIEFTVSIDYLWNLALEQNMKCALTGLPILFPTISDTQGNAHLNNNELQRLRTGAGRVAVASLDRLDSSKPYEEGNVQWVTKWINIMKNGLSQDEFIHLCHLVSSEHKDPMPKELFGFRYGRACRDVKDIPFLDVLPK